MTEHADMQARIAHLLERTPAGTVMSVTACARGGNNRTYRVKTEGRTLAVKQYFRHSDDTRDRMGTEFSFLSFATQAAPGYAPAALAMDREQGLAAYEFVEGRRLVAAELAWPHLQAAIDFFLALNSPRSRLLAQDLPVASEACFSVADHLTLVDRRVSGLLTGIADTIENTAAVQLVRNIKVYWDALSDSVRQSSTDYATSLPTEQRCLSPSDFGFHNALLQPDGRLRFLDFEYAGWDDPAKLAGDFFAQLAVPVPAGYFEDFVAAIASAFTAPGNLIARARLLRPVYQVKWCCIALNVFLPTHLARRQFANPDLDAWDLRLQQVAKAQAVFQSLPSL